jgi:hypothetical protein
LLDLEALVGGMQGLADQVVTSARETLRHREAARDQLDVARHLPGLRDAVLRFGQDMALPAGGRDMGKTYAAPAPGDYTVAAADGSQIAPDYHHVAPWYVVNTGCAVFRYGAPPGRSRCRLSSHPKLLPPRREIPAEDGHPEADARAAGVVERGAVEGRRLIGELETSLRLLEEEGDPGRTVLLLDGPLVQWRMITDIQPQEEQEEAIRLFRELLQKARESGTPVAGIISRSRAVAWVTLLRFTLCPSVAAEGRLCDACAGSLLETYTAPPPGAHHAGLAGVRDIELAETLPLEPGSRTEVVELKSRVWTRISGGDGVAGFFYLNTGAEIARVELPQWVWEDEALVARLHAVLWDQCSVGRGYPMVLAEAHEAAVVRAPDREAFYGLIERILNARGLPGSVTSAKAASKRRPFA